MFLHDRCLNFKVFFFFTDISWITKAIPLIPLLHHGPLQFFRVHSYALLHFPACCFCPRPVLVFVCQTALPLTSKAHSFPSYWEDGDTRTTTAPSSHPDSVAELPGGPPVNTDVLSLDLCASGWGLLLTASLPPHATYPPYHGSHH